MKSILQTKLSRTLCAVLFVIGMFASSNSKALCTASFYSVPDSIGSGVNFVSTSMGVTGTTNYYWTFGDGTVSYNANEYHVYNNGGWYQACLFIYDSLNGCSSTVCDSVYAGNSFMICQALFNTQSNGLTASFVSQSIGTNLNYSWNFGDGFTGSGQNATHQYAIAGQYLVCLTVWNSNCSDTICNYVSITTGGGGNCQSYFSSADSAGTTYFSGQATGTQGYVTYTWAFGDSTTGSGQYVTHTYNGFGYVVCLTVTDYDTLNGNILCTATYCDSVLGGGGGGNCQAAFNSAAGFLAGEIDFFDQSSASDSITSWFWNFGDGSNGTGANPQHIYSQAGNFYVCLTITTTNSNGTVTCTSTSCNWVQVQIAGGCQASFNAFDSSGIYVFINTSSGLTGTTNYYWNFGDGFTAYGMDATHTYNISGAYVVCLTISDSAAGCFDTYCDSIYVNGGVGGQCQASFILLPDSNISNGFIFYSNSLGVDAYTEYTWTSSDGFTSTGSSSILHAFPNNGWYQVCLNITVYDSLHQNILCTSQACDSVYANSGGGSSCNAYWNCQPSNFMAFFADLSTSTDTIVTWMWDFGDGTTSTQRNPVHTYSTSGWYYVCLTIQSASNGILTCTDTYCQSIYAGLNSTGCQANFSMYPDSAGGFQFQNLSTGITGATTYYWSFGDGNSSTQENPYHGFTNGYYTVCLTISDSNCTSTYCDSISVGQSPYCNPYFVWNGDTTNGVQFYQFNNNLPGLVYEWSFGDGDSSSIADPYHQYANAGVYYACLTVLQLDSNGLVICNGNYCDSIYVGGNAACAPQIIAAPDSNGWGNGNMSFSVSSACGTITSTTWNYGDGTTGTGNNSSHQYSITGWYYVCVDVEINGIIYTHCDSVFALRLMSVEDVANNISAIDVYPNPASSSMNVSYSLNDAHIVSVELFDVTGREVKQLAEQKQSTGLHKLVIDLKDISAGIYVLRISADETNVAKRMVVNR